MTETTYACSKCGKEAVVNSSDPVPKCCGIEMKAKPLPFCTTAPAAEMARSSVEDIPCDDGTNRSRKA